MGKWLPRRIKHHSFVAGLWLCVYLLGHFFLNDGLTFFLTVTFFARCGYSIAWMFITNFNHSHPWQNFLQKDPERSYPILHNLMALHMEANIAGTRCSSTTFIMLSPMRSGH